MDFDNTTMAPSPVQPLSRQGVRRISRSSNSFISAKQEIKIGNWNVRTLNQDGKIEELVVAFTKYGLDMCALTETRLTGIDKMNLDGGLSLLVSGREDGMHYQGVGLLLGPSAGNALTEWQPIDERLLYARFKSNHGSISMFVCYSPTNSAPDDRKDHFYERLQDAVDKVARHDILLCVGDFNAVLGSSNEGFEACMGKMGVGNEMSDNGIRFASFCLANDMVIGGTLFQHHDIHKATWVSPCGRYKNQIDHVAVSRRHRNSLLDVRVRRGGDVGSDHQLGVARLKFKLKSQKKEKSQACRYDIELLRKNGEEKENFRWECRNRFLVLEAVEDEERSVDEVWGDVRKALKETADCTIGRRSRLRRKKWMSDETWDMIKKRGEAKLRSEASRVDGREIELVRAEYWSLHSEVRRLVKRDKRRQINEKVAETEVLINKNNGQSQRIAYKSIKELNGCSYRRKDIPVKDRNGNLLTKDNDIKNRWKEHFETVLNRPIPPEEDIPAAERDLNIEGGEITIEEVKQAIGQLKNNKAPGEDGVFPEMFKVDEDRLPLVLVNLFNKIKEGGKLPSEWKNGVIVKIPKKGDLSDCGNWRGVMLSPIAMKIFCKLLLNRMEPILDGILREEQAGFRKGRGCSDQIFVVRHLMQQANEMKARLSLCFVDFEKAFDSVSRGVMGKVLRHYGVPEWLVKLVINLHEGTFCKVMIDGSLSDAFEVRSGVIQGGILSPLLFVLVIDYVMKRVIEETNAGIEWRNGRKLADLDYADDIVLISEGPEEMQRVVDCLVREGKKVGLVINCAKTEIMNINIDNQRDCVIGGRIVKQVERFKYLGTVLSKDGSLNKEFEERLQKANQAMGMLKTVWNNNNFSIHTKIRIYKTMVRPILIYGHESWYSTVTGDKKLLSFENKALRRILGIKWWHKVTNERLREVTGVQPVDEYVRLSRWKWLGHVFRKEGGIVQRTPGWQAQGRRGRGRPKETWVRTMRREAGDECWGDLEEMAQDRWWWREFIEALCIPLGATGID